MLMTYFIAVVYKIRISYFVIVSNSTSRETYISVIYIMCRLNLVLCECSREVVEEKLDILRELRRKIEIQMLRSFCSVLFCSVLFCSVLLCSVLFCSVLFCSVLLCSVLFCSVLFCSVLFCSVLFCSVLFCSVLFCSVLLCSVLFCSVLFCSVLFSSLLFSSIIIILLYSKKKQYKWEIRETHAS